MDSQPNLYGFLAWKSLCLGLASLGTSAGLDLEVLVEVKATMPAAFHNCRFKVATLFSFILCWKPSLSHGLDSKTREGRSDVEIYIA